MDIEHRKVMCDTGGFVYDTSVKVKHELIATKEMKGKGCSAFFHSISLHQAS